MPTLNIKDPEVYELAQELAHRLGTSMTNAVRGALVDAVQRQRQTSDDYIERMTTLATEIRESSIQPFLTDDDLYDERGLPR
ncbi:MAG TPA: type II toxin-antitoxin system VapB family antitoxin [Nocardioides sp.]|uniref:type II toxin-antitoxin system VapB family antitoxin n=1 Tax=uncultured Nocardioides sp. TaxID=198441 RepID=UPI000EDEF33E|nr:type II toxin-antitoxin system VapB family antitoxin [uncultured Nocardioides sp.]HCB03699.1 hypothetical protein [Nocardioides sp.]HRD60391.1 type II toxin-antitoxin system VapB family antitoxin [Nocardioides sp.]HRI94845.1 type II toxin-antitoxin system VapB family antitoxin [Nocardioides sp.]HRK45633.1 type II toxin-antitoxin system VapB family antitoxin [Nocardioides sp.]